MASVSGSVIQVDEQQVRSHVEEVVRSSVQETLNGLLDAEADQLCGAKRYERSPDRVDTLVDRHRGDIQLLRDLLGRQMLAGQPQGFILLFGKRVEDGMDIVPIHGAHLRYRAEGSNSKCQGGIT